jgi:hypothetical protein
VVGGRARSQQIMVAGSGGVVGVGVSGAHSVRRYVVLAGSDGDILSMVTGDHGSGGTVVVRVRREVMATQPWWPGSGLPGENQTKG